MIAFRSFLSDPITLGTVFSIIAGVITALIVVGLTFFFQGYRDLFESTRAIRSELEHNLDQLAKLSRLLQDDMQRQHVDFPIEIPADTTIEIRYVLSLPSSLNTTAFDQLRQSGRLMELSPEIRRELFDLYDTIDRINRLRSHRETLHYNNTENVHIVIDPSEMDVEPNTTINEEDLPPELRQRLEGLRRMRRAMRGINTSILRLIAAISSSDRIEELELGQFVEPDHAREPRGANVNAPAESAVPTMEEAISTLEDFEERSFWSRFV